MRVRHYNAVRAKWAGLGVNHRGAKVAFCALLPLGAWCCYASVLFLGLAGFCLFLLCWLALLFYCAGFLCLLIALFLICLSAADNADASAQAQPATGKHSPQARARREAIKAGKAPLPPNGPVIVDFNMIEEGDKLMVCMSGGKDSYTLLDILLKLQALRPFGLRLLRLI